MVNRPSMMLLVMTNPLVANSQHFPFIMRKKSAMAQAHDKDATSKTVLANMKQRCHL
jgi:hypothetical protein